MITYSAPGKVIFSGEHAVVYGKPALVCATNLRVHFSLEEGQQSALDQTKNNSQTQKSTEIVHDIVLSYIKKHQLSSKRKDVAYSVASHLPIGCGLGSSAAFSVAAVAAFLHLYLGKSSPADIVNSLAYACEKVFHSNPSGVDNSTSCFGGLVFYRKEFEFLKQISSLNAKLPTAFQKKLILIDTGRPEESTAEMVSIVGKSYNANSSLYEKIMNQIEKITKKMVISIVTEDVAFFGRCIEENQAQLEALGVVSPPSKKLLSSLSAFGVGKITGAGGAIKGSGIALFLAKDLNKLTQHLKKQKITFYPFTQSNIGVKLE